MDVVIVGAGPAGIAAAIQLRRSGVDFLLFEQKEIGGLLLNAHLVENYPGFPQGISGPDLVQKFKQQLERWEIPVSPGSVDRVEYRDGAFQVTTGGRELTGRFQLQFSVHSTDEKQREWLIPARKWPLDKIAAFGQEFFEPGDRKITLNFAVSDGLSVDPDALLERFPSEVFFIKLTPVNPTGRAMQNRISSDFDSLEADPPIAAYLREAGYDVLYSIGELEENKIGSNCGQHIMHYRNSSQQIEGSYTYRLFIL